MALGVCICPVRTPYLYLYVVAIAPCMLLVQTRCRGERLDESDRRYPKEEKVHSNARTWYRGRHHTDLSAEQRALSEWRQDAWKSLVVGRWAMDKQHSTILSLYPSAESVEPVFILVAKCVFLSPCLTGLQ